MSDISLCVALLRWQLKAPSLLVLQGIGPGAQADCDYSRIARHYVACVSLPCTPAGAEKGVELMCLGTVLADCGT